ncbi:CsbD family protein [Acidimangrovimonas sediminis]|uniref:CsbD family protein n=1 Tax=Acidimangrovimonas sediminis TaxID=2056283 RepID=UPI000C8087CF|nr:CsbD family protein [Acidimangrovimonas sediminis]
MNKDQMEGNWKQLKGKVRAKWGDLTDDDVASVDGRREVLAGKIQERYGKTKEEAEKQIDEWLGSN